MRKNPPEGCTRRPRKHEAHPNSFWVRVLFFSLPPASFREEETTLSSTHTVNVQRRPATATKATHTLLRSKRWRKPHTHTRTLESDRGHTHTRTYARRPAEHIDAPGPRARSPPAQEQEVFTTGHLRSRHPAVWSRRESAAAGSGQPQQGLLLRCLVGRVGLVRRTLAWHR